MNKLLYFLTRLGIFILIVIQPTKIHCTGTVKWVVETSPIIFGGAVTLMCYVPAGTCMPNHVRQWSGGLGYKVLVINGSTNNAAKYEMKTNRTTLDFKLMVKNFSLSDENCDYTCICGRSHYTDILMVNESKYILMPKGHRIHDNSLTLDKKLHINITIEEIHPIPNCTVYYNKKIKHLPYTSTDLKRLFYQVSLVGSFPLQNIDCRISYIVSCSLETKKFELNRKILYWCDSNAILATGAIFVAMVVIVVVIVGFVVSWLCKRRYSNDMHGSTETNIMECPISTNGISKESKELLAVSKLKDNEELEKMDDELNIIAEHNGKTIPPNDKRRQLMIPSAL